MTEYFVPPPYYYKQFQTPNEFPQPNLKQVMNHVDDYYSFGEFHNFTQSEYNQLELLRQQLQQHNLTGNLKLKLKELSNQIFQLCILIQESIAKVNKDHMQLGKELKEKTFQFNLICQFLNQKEKYQKLEEIYQTEIQQLSQLNQEMNIKLVQIEEQMKEISTEQLFE